MSEFPRVKSLKLKNFKGIAELELDFDECLTLLAGVNGAGKTSVLRALLAAVTQTWGHLQPVYNYPRFGLPERVPRAGATRAEIVLGLTLDGRSRVEVQYVADQQDQRLIKVGPSQPPRTSEQAPPPLPLVVYYEQGRAFAPDRSGHRVLVSAEENRKSCLNTTVRSPIEFQSWFFEKEADESQVVRERNDPQYEDRELAEVRNLLDSLDGFTAVRSRKVPDRPQRTLFLEKDGANIPFDSLSGGEQAFFMLAADLARRLMLDSPDRPVAEAPGIVCIDEIELHLHPAWQRRILTTLMQTFPACQFVVTTHSPQVIGGVEARHVRLLTLGEDGVREARQPIASKGRDSNYILSGVLDTPEREDEVSRLFAELDDMLDDGDLENAERRLRKLDEAVEGQSAAVATRQARLNRLRRAAE